jgi:hypothetical protein
MSGGNLKQGFHGRPGGLVLRVADGAEHPLHMRNARRCRSEFHVKRHAVGPRVTRDL